MITISCKKQYTPQLTSVTTNWLAVDGTIISGDSTFIRLSRSTKLTDTTRNKAELKATVTVEGDQKTLYPLTEKGKGLYVLGVTNFDFAHKYRLNIKTNDGKIYQSDFVPVKKTPPIDSIYFEAKDDNHILFYVDTHDATNSTRYYRWDYKETWRYTALYHASVAYKNGTVSYINYGDFDISTCYRTAMSNQIFVGSTVKNASDILIRHQLGGIDNSQKIARGYVLQVKQYALTKEGFEYYQNLKTNTEQLGSIFDPQASFLKGNICCISNPSETVIGFVSASTVANKQVNLSYSQIPIYLKNEYGTIEWYKGHYYNSFTTVKPAPEDCPAKAVENKPGKTFQQVADDLLARDSIIFDVDFPKGPPVYFYTPRVCVDCRLQGGTTTKPSYFPFR